MKSKLKLFVALKSFKGSDTGNKDVNLHFKSNVINQTTILMNLSKIPHIFFHIFLYRDEYGYISIQREKLEAKFGYTQITPIIIVDP